MFFGIFLNEAKAGPLGPSAAQDLAELQRTQGLAFSKQAPGDVPAEPLSWGSFIVLGT